MKPRSRCMKIVDSVSQAQSSITGAKAVVVTRHPATVWCRVKETDSEQPSG